MNCPPVLSPKENAHTRVADQWSLSALGTPILVPLTPSLYVPGKLASTETVLVDVGTGFYIEKSPDAAQDFYKRKVDEIGKNLSDLEKIVQGKQGNLNVVEDGEYSR